MNFYSTTAEDVLSEFNVNKDQGLSNQQVGDQRVLHGENKLPEPPKKTFLERLIKQLINPLVLILIGAFILTIVLDEYVDAVVILVAVAVNVVVALIQEGKASEAYELLQKKRTHRAIVVRGGKKEEIDLVDLVVGDIVILQAGMYTPADIRVIEATNLTANQVMFTGESIPVEKTPEISDTEDIFARSSMVFTGSTIASGSGLGVVTAVGSGTAFADIAQSLLSVEKEKSPIEKQSEHIAKIISIVAGVIIVMILLLGIYRGLPFYELILLAIAIAVSAVPEGLPSAITAILAYGASLIGKEGGLVKNLSSAQTLGSTDVILTDKTGTLTYGHMEIVEIIGRGTATKDHRTIAEHALLATDVFYDEHHKRFVGDDVDQAIGRYFLYGGEYVNDLLADSPMDHVVPFDSRYKFFASVREWNGKTSVFSKGAFSVLWENCDKVLDDGVERDITDQDYEHFRKIIDGATQKGKRIIAVAHNNLVQIPENESDPHQILQGAVFCGLLVMEDQVRDTATKAVYEAQEAGVSVIMITGDAASTARTIAHETGIVDNPNAQVMLGKDIDGYSDDELYDEMFKNGLRIFSRVSPEHKLRLVDLLTERGKTVAMTGDGVNDSLALSRAAIGISLSSATEVAKESADLILTNNSFATIMFALKEGRRIAANITKTIIYLVSTSFSEVLVIAAALLFTLPVPFLPSHILWANILEEGLMNFAFLFEPNRTPQNKPRKIINKQVVQAVSSIAVLNSLLFLALYGGLYMFTETSIEMKRTIMFGALAVSALFLSWSVRSISRPFWKLDISSNRFFVIATVINICLFLLTIGTEIGREFMHLEPMTAMMLVGLLVFGVLNVISVELTKALFWRKRV